jgi:hypothetical protein
MPTSAEINPPTLRNAPDVVVIFLSTLAELTKEGGWESFPCGSWKSVGFWEPST